MKSEFLHGRRRFLLGMASVAAIGALPFGISAAAKPAKGKHRIIDTHHHFVPKNYLKFAKKHGLFIKTYHEEFDKPWDVQRDLADMNVAGAAVAMLNITTPGFGFGKVPDKEIQQIIRATNEEAAELGNRFPGRFGSLAAIPLTDTEAALREVEYALDSLKADGVSVYSNYGGRWLGDAGFAPVYEELNRRNAVVFVHPVAGDCCSRLVPHVNDNIMEFAADTTRTIASLLYTGTTRKYPNIRWIFSHGGGTVPFIIERFLLGSGKVEIVPGIVTQGQYGPAPENLPEGALPEIRKLYFDTAHTSNPIALDALKKLMPVSQIVFGSDYWYRTAQETADNMYASKVFTESELAQVTHGNAERLFPRFASAK